MVAADSDGDRGPITAFQCPVAAARARRSRQPVARFGFENVQHIAQQRSASPIVTAAPSCPRASAKLSYEDYRNIQFRAEHALWRNQALFEVQFFHRGFAYDRRVNVTEIGADGMLRADQLRAVAVRFRQERAAARTCRPIWASPGLRVHYPVAAPRLQGRADRISRRLLLSACSGAIRAMVPRRAAWRSTWPSTDGEEFPYFSDFWLVRPPPEQRTLTIYALLDSPSLTGAYRFEVRPGTTSDRRGHGDAVRPPERGQAGHGADDLDVPVRRGSAAPVR